MKSDHETNEATSVRQAGWQCPDLNQRAAWSVGYLLATGYLFWPLFREFVQRWSNEPQYSHGFVIPLMAVGLGWFLFDRISAGTARSSWTGIPFIAVGVVLHIVGVHIYVEAADCLGLLSCITGGLLLIWGRRFVLAVWPAILFLVFMFPLPFRVERLLSGPLQLYGADTSAWFIQMFGIPAVARGSMILMGDLKLGVAEACSGMRMLTVFIAISAATTIITNRTAWEKAVILLASIPIALMCNIARIVATALAHTWFGSETANLIFHDLSGWLMMPSAMVLLYLLLKTLDFIFVEDTTAENETYRPVGGLPGMAGLSAMKARPQH